MMEPGECSPIPEGGGGPGRSLPVGPEIFGVGSRGGGEPMPGGRLFLSGGTASASVDAPEAKNRKQHTPNDKHQQRVSTANHTIKKDCCKIFQLLQRLN